MPDEKIPAMPTINPPVGGTANASSLYVAAIYSTGSGYYNAKVYGPDIPQIPQRLQTAHSSVSPPTIHPIDGPRIAVVTGGSGGTEYIDLARWPVSYDYARPTCQVYIKTRTNPADAVVVQYSGGAVRVGAARGNIAQQKAKPKLKGKGSIAVFDWTYYGWQFNGDRSYFVGGGGAYYYNVNAPCVIGGGGDTIITGYKTSDPGVSGAIWRDPTTGIAHISP